MDPAADRPCNIGKGSEGAIYVAREMISSIQIKNFKCFKQLKLDYCRQFNIIVGENGVGKTALLEAIFMTLGHSPRLAMTMQKRRGVEGSFSGEWSAIEEAVWRDMFFDWDLPAEVRLAGVGFENRTLTISRNTQGKSTKLSMANGSETTSMAVQFVYTNHQGHRFPIHPEISNDKLEFPSTPEKIPDFYSFASNSTPSASELAARFSRLRMAGKQGDFVNFMQGEYPLLSDIGVDSLAGSPALTACIDGSTRRLPINLISSGISKIASIALAMFVRPNGVVLIDEIENGIYYKHHLGVWKGLIRVAGLTGTQLFVTTHSAESLRALAAAAGEMPEEFSLWNIARRGDSMSPAITQFSGQDMFAAIEYNSEIR